MTALPIRVIKFGGSLLDSPALGERFADWLSRQTPALNLMVVGGGSLVEAIRAVERAHPLDEATAHLLCIRAMSITAQLAVQLLPGSVLVEWPVDANCGGIGQRDLVRVLDITRFIEEDAARSSDPLPSEWQVTSDSIAARVAWVLNAAELVLLKSTLPAGSNPETLAAAGYVDRFFPRAALVRPVRFVNLRALDYAERVLDR